MELTIHSSQVVLLAQPLRLHCLLYLQLPTMDCSNRKFICMLFSFPHLKQFLMQLHRCEGGSCNIALSSDYHSVAQLLITSIIFLKGFLMLGSLVSIIEMLQAIIYSFTGIFTLRTFAIYQNNWVVLSSLAVLGISRVSLALVWISNLFAYLPMLLMVLHSLATSSRSPLR